MKYALYVKTTVENIEGGGIQNNLIYMSSYKICITCKKGTCS